MWLWFVLFILLLIVLLFCLKVPKKDKFPKIETNELTDVSLRTVINRQNELFAKKGYSDMPYFYNTISCPSNNIYIKRFGNVFELINDQYTLFSTKDIPDIVDDCWHTHHMIVLLCRHNHKHTLKVYNFSKELLFMTEPFVFHDGVWFLDNGFFCLGIFNLNTELRYYSLDEYKGYLIKSYPDPIQINILSILDQDEAILSEYPAFKVELISHSQVEKPLRLLSSDHLKVFGFRCGHHYSFDEEMHQIVISNVVMISHVFTLEPPIPKSTIVNAILFDTHLIAIVWKCQQEFCISIFDEFEEATINNITSSVNCNGVFTNCPITEIVPFGYGFYYKCEYIHIPPIIFKYEKDEASIAMEVPIEIDLDHVYCQLQDFKILLICPKSFNIQKIQYIHVILSKDKRYNACQSVDFIKQQHGLVIYFDISLLHLRNMTLYLQHYKQLLSFIKELSCYQQCKTSLFAEDLGASLVAMHLTNDFNEIVLKNGKYLFENDLIMQSPIHLIFEIKSIIRIIGKDEMSLKYLMHLQELCPKAYGHITTIDAPRELE